MIDVVELVTFKTKTPNPDETVKQKRAAVDILTSFKECGGIAFQGMALEEPNVSVLCVKRDSYRSSQFERLQNAEGGTLEKTISRNHYKLFDNLEQSLSQRPRCIELVTYSLKDGVSFEEFYQEWHSGLMGVEDCPGCCPITLGQQIENPSGVVQIQPWMTLTDHLDKFKKRGDLNLIMAPLAESVAKFVRNGWGGMKAYHVLLGSPVQVL